jgi:MFS family permease
MQVGMLAGPALGGLLIAHAGLRWAYAVDAVALAVTTLLYARLGRRRVAPSGRPPGLAALREGMSYAAGRPALLGTYVVDLTAMVTAMPEVIYPAFAATVLHRPDLLGLLYSAGTAGGILTTLTSRWVARVHRHGRMVVLAAAAWGAAIAVAGVASSVWLVLAALVLAGAADTVSMLFRSVIWNQTIPEEMRGRMAGIEMLSYSVGPLGGQVRAGLSADLFGVRRAIAGGGLLCVVGVSAAALALRGMWAYDARTDEHALRERALRAAR